MAGPRSGLNAQIGYAAETTWGTGVTVTRFIPLISENIAQKIDRTESKGLIAGARMLKSQQWQAGKIAVAGPIQHEVYDRSIGLLLKHAFGTSATSGSGPYIHTMSPGDLDNLGLTIQVGRPDVSGTVQPFTFAGCKISSWEIACAAGEIATMGLQVVGATEVTATALASASYASSIAPMTFVGGSITIAGSAYKVTKASLKGDNKLDAGRYFIGQTTISEPIESDLRDYTGMLDSEFISLTAYNRFVNGTEAALVLTLAKGAATLVITMNVRFDGDSPRVDGPKILHQPLPFKCVGSTTDASGITSVLTNGDATV